MDWQTVKDLLAVWGAVLSTWLFIAKLAEDKPIVVLEAIEPDVGVKGIFRVRIENPAKYPVHVSHVRVLYPKDSAFWDVGTGERKKAEAFAEHTGMRVDRMVPSSGETSVSFGIDDKRGPTTLIVTVRWFRSQPLVLPRFPRLIVRTKSQVTALQADPVKV
jgi:hypothetical protein